MMDDGWVGAWMDESRMHGSWKMAAFGARVPLVLLSHKYRQLSAPGSLQSSSHIYGPRIRAVRLPPPKGWGGPLGTGFLTEIDDVSTKSLLPSSCGQIPVGRIFNLTIWMRSRTFV